MTTARNAALRTALALCLLGSAGCGRRPDKTSLSWPIMGTVATLTAAGPDKRHLDEFVDDMKRRLSGLNAMLSVYVPESDLSRLSDNAGGEFIPVSEETAELLALACRYAELSEGAFDPTVAPLVRLWGFSGGTPPTRVPDESAIASARSLVGCGNVLIKAGNVGGRPAARLAVPGGRIDLGGVAKGYAVDVCFEALKAAGASRAIVDLGGNMRCIGAPSPERAWRIGVRNPFDRGAIVGVLNLSDGAAVATSGNYERFVTIDGERFSHIIDPRTGRPAKGMAGVTVVAPTAADADALSTALFVLGAEKGAALAARQPGCAAIFIPDTRPLRLMITPGMEDMFSPCPDYAGQVTRLAAAPPNIEAEKSR